MLRSRNQEGGVIKKENRQGGKVGTAKIRRSRGPGNRDESCEEKMTDGGRPVAGGVGLILEGCPWRCRLWRGHAWPPAEEGQAPSSKSAIMTPTPASATRCSCPPLRSAAIPACDRLIRVLPTPWCEGIPCRLSLVFSIFLSASRIEDPSSCPPSRSTRPRSSRSSDGSAQSPRSRFWRRVADCLACRYTTEEFDELCFEFGMSNEPFLRGACGC